MNKLKTYTTGIIFTGAVLFFVAGISIVIFEESRSVQKNSPMYEPPTHDLLVNWPSPYATLSENQRFIVRVEEMRDSNASVRVFWNVDNGLLGGEMQFDGENYASEVEISQWDWKKDGTYQLTFRAVDVADAVLAQTSMFVYVGALSDITLSTSTGMVQDLDSAYVQTQVATVYDAYTPPKTQTPPVVVVSTPSPTPFRIEWVPAPVRQAQKFIFHTEGYDTARTQMFWKAEGGHANMVYRANNATLPTALINLFGWQWKGAGPYTIIFSITDSTTSAELAKEEIEMRWSGKPGESEIQITSKGVLTTTKPVVHIPQGGVSSTSNTSTPPPSPQVTAPPAPNKPATPAVVVGALATTKLFVPQKPAVSRTLTGTLTASEKEAIEYIVRQPSAVWLNGDGYDTNANIEGVFTEAKKQGAIPTFVLYNIPNRDCGSHSSGGARSASDYRAWIDRLAGVFSGREAYVIIEPDALPQLNCVSGVQREERIVLLRYATERMTSASSALRVYLDAGHPFWVNAEEMARRLTETGVKRARGFSLNVSNYVSTSDNVQYGTHVSNLLGGSHFIIDTSRNGNGQSPTREWCNPSGRALGESPKVFAGGYLDAFIWIKFPGESDGACNGGPSAGAWWKEYAVSLFTNRAR